MANRFKIERVSGRAIAVARRRHRHRPDHPGAVPQDHHVRWPRDHVFEDDRLQLPSRGATHPVRRPALPGRAAAVRRRRTSAADRRASTRRRPSRAGASARSSGVVRGDLLRQLADDGPAVRDRVARGHRAADRARRSAARISSSRWICTTSRITAGDLTVPVGLPEACARRSLSGNWDATGLLVDRYEEVERVAARLPYVSGWNALSRQRRAASSRRRAFGGAAVPGDLEKRLGRVRQPAFAPVHEPHLPRRPQLGHAHLDQLAARQSRPSRSGAAGARRPVPSRRRA